MNTIKRPAGWDIIAQHDIFSQINSNLSVVICHMDRQGESGRYKGEFVVWNHNAIRPGTFHGDYYPYESNLHEALNRAICSMSKRVKHYEDIYEVRAHPDKVAA